MTKFPRRLVVAFPAALLAGCLFNGGSDLTAEPAPNEPPDEPPGPPPVIHPRITAYVTGVGPVLTAFDVDPETGALTQVGAPAPAGNEPQQVVVDPAAKFAYLVNSFTIVGYRLDGEGSAPIATGETYPVPSVVGIAIHPLGTSVYAVDTSNGLIQMFTASPDSGRLEPNGSVATAVRPRYITTHPSGRFAYVTHNGNGLGSIWVYAIDQDGVLSEIPGNRIDLPFDPPGDIVIDPAGRYAYVAIFGSQVWAYEIEPTTGALNFVGAVDVGLSPHGIAVHPSGNFVYALASQRDTVSALTMVNGVFSLLDSYPTGEEPFGLTVDVSGRFAYVANLSADTISVFQIDASTGALKSSGQPSSLASGYSPRGIVVVERPR